MISNLQLKNLMDAETKNCTVYELILIQEFLTVLVSIDYHVYSYHRDKLNAAFTNELHDISPKTKEEAA
jgi:hypothetical protein